MCGILGIVQTDQRPFQERPILSRLLETLAARGPDDAGLYIKNQIGFGHHRLAIRDLQAGRQPMVSPDQQCVLVYNGELYNDQELRTTLARDYDFQTMCDTEVVLAAYLRWGQACVERFRGMFAFGLYDFSKQSLWLVRDRIGVKPLFFSWIGDQLVFASRLATILAHPRFSKQPDWDVLSHYLSTTRMTLGHRTLYAGVYQLLPAEHMTWRDEQHSTKRYWDYPSGQSNISYDDAVDELHEELSLATQIRMQSDVPVGMFLSGGVDSSTLASLISKSSHGPLYATCGGVHTDSRQSVVEDKANEELYFAARCAEQVQFDLHPIQVDSGSYLERWHELLRDYRTPLSTPSDVVIYSLAKAAKQHVGVVIGGEGSDELLCGYEITHWSGHDYDAVATSGANSHRTVNPRLLRSIQKQYGRSKFQSEADHYFALNSLLPSELKPSMLSESLWRETGGDQAMRAHYQGMYDEMSGATTVEKNAILLHRINLEALLARLDAATMQAGLETRVPFTDHVLVEKMFRLPFHYRIDVNDAAESNCLASADLAALGRLRPKRILRSVARRLMTPDLANRKKASFPTGVLQWFQSDWVGWISSILANSPFARLLFRDSFLRDLIQAPARAGMWLWPITNLVMWGDAEFA